MTAQLDIYGGEKPLDGLTERQRMALTFIREHSPVASDELGAEMHSWRQEHGGLGHPPDFRCRYCQEEGRQMGAVLADKGLVEHHATLGWRPL